MPDDRFEWLCEQYKPKSRVPANLTIFDIAGLTKGSSTGAGLGNAFLSHIRAVDAIFQVVRCFDDANVVHVNGRVDPLSDIETIQTELALADLATVDKALARYVKPARAGDKEAALATATRALEKDPQNALALTVERRVTRGYDAARKH